VNILPFIEQGPVYDSYNLSLSCWDPVNEAAVGTHIEGYVCPSNPSSDRLINYTIPAGGILPGLPAMSLVNAGPIDYVATTAVTEAFVRIARNDPSLQIPDDHLEGWGLGVVGIVGATPMEEASGGKIGDIRDGTSNTIIIGELVGRNELIRNGKVITSTSDPEAIAASMLGGGAWADPFNGSWEVSGRLYDGTGGEGPCAINCSNARVRTPTSAYRNAAGLYSFHPGGAQTLLGDGSVSFLSETTAAAVFAAMISRAGGETVSQ
jgi:hypothetical protein